MLDEGHFVPGWEQAETLCPLRSDASTAMVCSVRHDHRGLFYGVTAYVLWGIFPLYFRLLEPAGAAEVVAYRVAGALVSLALVVAAIGRWAQFRAVVRHGRSRSLLASAAVLIAINWGTYIWGVYNDRVVEASLGYFINPLVTILLGVLFLGERLGRWQWAAIAVAVSAVVVLTIDYGRPPWVAVIIALTFGSYGLTRKLAGVDSVEGLTYETMVLAPVAFGYLIWLDLVGHSQLFGHGAGHVLLLTSLGLVTAIPLLSFGAAAVRLSMTTLGLLQYLTPTIQFALGVTVLEEKMPVMRWVGFGLVWMALLVFTTDSFRHRREVRTTSRIQRAGDSGTTAKV